MGYGFLIDQDGGILFMNQDEPVTHKEVITCPEKCQKAMKFEMESIYTNEVWPCLINLKV